MLLENSFVSRRMPPSKGIFTAENRQGDTGNATAHLLELGVAHTTLRPQAMRVVEGTGGLPTMQPPL